MGFQTAYRPRPVLNERPQTPVVPIERVRPTVRLVPEPVEPEPAPEPRPGMVSPEDRAKWQAVDALPVFNAHKQAMQIVNRIAFAHGLTFEDIIGQSRKGSIVPARQEAVAAVYVAFGGGSDLPPERRWSLPKIGKFFGGRDHTTILHACKKMGVWQP